MHNFQSTQHFWQQCNTETNTQIQIITKRLENAKKNSCEQAAKLEIPGSQLQIQLEKQPKESNSGAQRYLNMLHAL